MESPALRHSFLLNGSPAPEPAWIELACGPLTLQFDPVSGWARYLRIGDREVLRALYVAVRDQNWDTVSPQLSNLDIETAGGGFRVTFEAICQQRDVDFRWRGTLTGAPDGTTRYAMAGEARAPFRKNRIGFCALYPTAENAGQPCTVEHSDGQVEEARFPARISPHQPLFDIRALTHRIAAGLWAEVRFEGDIFEMEDQRNWTDASYKIYCTPLARPFPVAIARGTMIAQSVLLTLRGRPRRVVTSSVGTTVTLRPGPPSALRRLPQVGVALASREQDLTEREMARLRALNLSHLRAELCQQGTDWAGNFEAARRLALRWQDGPQLECALSLESADETPTSALTRAGQRLAEISSSLRRVLLYARYEKATPAPWIALARRSWRQTLRRHCPIYGGTDAYFAELNRNRPDHRVLEGVCYSLNPQVHAFDDATLVESLAAQADTVHSARALSGRKPIAVSPVTLRPRFNPNATGPETEPEPGELPSQVDTRQMSLFGAGWTLGSLKYLSESGASSVTYYETTGWRGVMETEAGSPLPDRFPSIPGAVFPLYHVLADVGEFRDGKARRLTSSDPLRVEAFWIQQNSRSAFFIANLTSRPQTVRLPLSEGERDLWLRRLDAANVEYAMREPEAYREEPGEPRTIRNGFVEIELTPYAYARLTQR